MAIPTYNGQSTIGPAIASVLAQTHTDFELLVFDDRSTDDTAAVVASFSDPRLRFERHSRNLGAEGNWNHALGQARGRYFKLLPHDDLLTPDCLQRQVNVLETDRANDIALVCSARDVLAPDGRVLLRHRGIPGAREGRLQAKALRRRCVRAGTNLLGEPGAVLFRTDLARQTGQFDGRDPYVIDMDYWFRLLEHGDAWYCDQALASFRVSATQWSVVLGDQQSRDFRRCVSRHNRQGALGLSLADQLLGAVTPVLNSLARQAFYKVYLR